MNDTTTSSSQAPNLDPTTAGQQTTAPQLRNSDPRRKSGIVTVLLSVFPGLGHAYVGYYQRGFVHFAIYGFAISLHASDTIEALDALTFLFVPFFWIFTQIDAYRRAMLYNMSLDGFKFAPLPDDINEPSSGGNLIGGVLLTVAGLMALLNIQFGVTFEWLEDWWPVAPIALGVFLIYGNYKEKGKQA